MSSPASDFLPLLNARGYIHQCTDQEGLGRLAGKKAITAYSGFDCTAPSLHVGNLLQIMTLRRLQQAGHKPIVLLGGGTTKIGDPSGKDEARQLLTTDAIETNKKGILRVFERFLVFGDGPSDAFMVDNAEWLDKLEYIPLLREVGRHFSVNRMLTMDSVRLRLERDQPLSFLEFNYMILQAYDFVELKKRYDCVLQTGGSDQWGNIVSGIDLGRRLLSADLFGLTTPLLTTTSGAKMGKTAQGAVWLSAEMLSPWDYWQFWRNVEDADVGRFMRLFTDMPLSEIADYEKLKGQDINEAKKRLATETTALLHGREAADEAQATARKTFEEGTSGDALPTLALSKADLDKGVALFEIMRRAGLAESSSAARRLIKGGGARINDAQVSDENILLTSKDVGEAGHIKISAGRKRHVLLRPE